MKTRVMDFLARLDTVNAVPPQLKNGELAIFHIASGQCFSLLKGNDHHEPDEMPAFIVTTSSGDRFSLQAHKVIRFLLIDYSRSCEVSEGSDANVEFEHIKQHLLHKTGFSL